MLHEHKAEVEIYDHYDVPHHNQQYILLPAKSLVFDFRQLAETPQPHYFLRSTFVDQRFPECSGFPHAELSGSLLVHACVASGFLALRCATSVFFLWVPFSLITNTVRFSKDVLSLCGNTCPDESYERTTYRRLEVW